MLQKWQKLNKKQKKTGFFPYQLILAVDKTVNKHQHFQACMVYSIPKSESRIYNGGGGGDEKLLA